MVDVPQVDSDGVLSFELDGLVDHELVFLEGRACDLVGSVESHDEDVDDHCVELENEGGELQAHQKAVVVGVVHIFEVDDHVVLCGHVICNVVVDNQSKQPVQQSQIDFLVYLVKPRLHQHQRLVFAGLPNAVQVVYSLTIFVQEERGWFGVTGFDPVGEQSPFFSLVPKVLIEICVSDLFKRIDFVGGNQMAVKIHKGKSDLFEDSLSQ
jgi:hypothetical protein